MQAVLSFEQAPPFAAPLRFFLSAPLFAAAAGVLLFVEGDALFLSRWTPAALAATHLLTLGFMLQVMFGALIQILPVMAGANLRRPAWLATSTHSLLVPGMLCLVWGFLAGASGFLHVGAALLAAAVLLFLVACAAAFRGVPSTSPTIRGIKLALCSLFATVLLGLFLVVALLRGTDLSLPALTGLHAAWGLAGWSGILLAAVAYVVVPMFQLTPGYPARASWWFPVAVFAALLAWSAGVWLSLDVAVRLAQAMLSVAGMSFCLLTLRLQRQRRRARSDSTTRYWQFGLTSCLLAASMLLAAALWPSLAEAAWWSPVLAVMLISGGLMSFITGMLYKIIPFLAWMHLQNQGQGRFVAPTMNKFLAENRMLAQFRMHAAMTVAALLAAFYPAWLARPAGVLLVLSSLWLAVNLFSAIRYYRRYADELVAA